MASITWIDKRLAFYRSSMHYNAYDILEFISNDIDRLRNLSIEPSKLTELLYFRPLAQLICGLEKDATDSFKALIRECAGSSDSDFILGLSEFQLAKISYKHRDLTKAFIFFSNASLYFKNCHSYEYLALSRLGMSTILLFQNKIKACKLLLDEVSALFEAKRIPVEYIEESNKANFLRLSGLNFKEESFNELSSYYLSVLAQYYFQVGKITLALRKLENAIKVDELNDLKHSKLKNLILKADFLIRLENYDAALDILEHSIELIADNVRVYYDELSRIYIFMAKVNLSEDHIDEKRAFKFLMLSLNVSKQYDLKLNAAHVLDIYSEISENQKINKITLSVNADNLIHWLNMFSADAPAGIKSIIFKSISAYYSKINESAKAIKYLAKTNSINEALRNQALNQATDQIDFIRIEGQKRIEEKQSHIDSMNTKLAEQEKLSSENEHLKSEIEYKTNELFKKSNELNDYLKIATHDFKEPIRNMVNMTQLLNKKLSSSVSGEEKQLLEYVINSGIQLNSLSNDLIEYVNVINNSPRIQNIDILEMINNIKHNDLNEPNAKHLSLSLDLDTDVIRADYYSIYMLFKGIIKNAVHFSRDGVAPRVKIVGRELDNQWKFAVMDNGIGLEDKYFKEIFKPFTKLRKTSGPHNNGIGLSICQKAVELHGGRIWLNSIPGKGSTFHFTLNKALIFKHKAEIKA